MPLFTINVTYNFDPSEIVQRLAAVESKLDTLLERIASMSAELDRLTTEVSETSGVIDSAIVLLNGLAQQIRDLRTDPVALAALADSLDAKQAELADAVAANTTP